jgi:hypothetical protein
MSGQSFQDRIIAARYSIAGQGLAKAVCKATTEEVMGPKKKHVDYLMLCTNEPNVSIPQMANLLIERTQHTNWVVVYKSLVTIHNLMNYGNERFTQYLASNNCNLNLENFLDKTGVQGYDMSTYIRRYAKYLNGKAYSYRVMAFDFCKVKRGKDDGLLRTMDTDKLLKTLPILQQQLDALLEFDVSANELTNGVVNACFMLLFKDLIRLFACYNDGIINLLELFFDMNKKQAREAFDLYKKFLSRMDRCSEFLKIAEAVGIDKGDIPDLAKAPSSLLTALEEHLKTMDDKPKKVKDRSKGAATASGGQLSSPTKAGATGGGLSEEEKRKIVEEEGKQLEKLKEQAMKKAGSPTGGAAASSSLFGDDDQSATNAADLFGAPPQPSSQVRSDVQSTINSMKASNQKMSDDLVGLGFDFGDSGSGGMELAANNPFAMPDTSASPWGPPGFDTFGDLLKPQSNSKGPSLASMQTASPKKDVIVKGDIDSSLANLAGSLSMNGPPALAKQGLNWNPSKETKLTGGGNSGTIAGFTGTAPNMAPTAVGAAMNFQNGSMGGAPNSQQYYAPQMMGAQPPGYMPPRQPAWGMAGGQPAVGGFQQPMGMGQPAGGAFPPPASSQPQATTPSNDPFGSLL